MRVLRSSTISLSLGCSLIAIAAAGCGEQVSERVWPSVKVIPTLSHNRILLAERWDTIATLTPKAAGFPFGFFVSSNGFAYYDQINHRLVGFDRKGNEVHTSDTALGGRESLGEIRNVRLLADGRIAALDANRHELVILSRDWSSMKRVNLRAKGRIEQFIPYGKSGFLLWTFDADRPFEVLDSAGAPLGTISILWPQYRGLHPLTRSGILASDENENWVYAFSSGAGWFPYRGAQSRGFQAYIEPLPFPAVLEQSEGSNTNAHLGRFTTAARAGIVVSGTFYVLFGGKSDLRGRLIDEYRMSDGTYLKSLVVPPDGVALAARAGKIYLLTADPVVRVLSRAIQ